MAKAAEAGGADAVSLINTLTGMKIDINRRTFALANKTGGMSGPASNRWLSAWYIRSAHAVKIPIIGMGGITDGRGCAGVHPRRSDSSIRRNSELSSIRHATMEVIEGIEAYMKKYGVEDIRRVNWCCALRILF